MRPGKRTPPRSSSCTRCATASRPLEKKTSTTDMMDIHQILKQLPHRYPVPAGGPRARAREGQEHQGAEERDDQRAVLHRPLPAPAGDAGRADARGDGAGGGAAVVRHAGRRRRTTRRSIYFAGIDGARFKRPVEPGDQLVMDVELLRAQGRHLQVQGRRARGRGDRLRGRADVHHAHRGLSPKARMAQIHPTAIVDPQAAARRRRHGRAVHADRPAREDRRRHHGRPARA